MEIINFLKHIFTPSNNYKKVRPVQVYVMKLFFALMFLLVAKGAWTELIFHKGTWNSEIAVAWCSIAAYTTLSGLGIFNALKMLPIMLFMILYKSLWLFFVAFPLWMTGQLKGSDAEGWMQIFIIVIVPIIFMPWKYVFKTFVLGKNL